MGNELKPCPFCGNLPAYCPDANGPTVFYCGTPGCPAYANRPLPLESWNRRPEAAQRPEERSEYDAAVEALAPYLPDGWVAQDKDCTVTTLFKIRPGSGEWAWTCVDTEFEFSLEPFEFPKAPDWRASLRRIENGKVVP